MAYVIAVVFAGLMGFSTSLIVVSVGMRHWWQSLNDDEKQANPGRMQVIYHVAAGVAGSSGALLGLFLIHYLQTHCGL